MAVGQIILVFSLSRGDASGYVERGLWPNEGALNAGAELIAESSLIRPRRAGNGSLTTRSLIAPDVTTSQLCYLCGSVFSNRVCVPRRGVFETQRHRGKELRMRGKMGDERKRPTNPIPAWLVSLVAGVNVSSFYRWQNRSSS